jgi:hypothetical protein
VRIFPNVSLAERISPVGIYVSVGPVNNLSQAINIFERVLKISPDGRFINSTNTTLFGAKLTTELEKMRIARRWIINNHGQLKSWCLNVHQLERQGADIQSRVDELEELNESLRERDKTKDDAIAQLSGQLMTLTVRLQEIEGKFVVPLPFSCVVWLTLIRFILDNLSNLSMIRGRIFSTLADFFVLALVPL